MYLASVGGVLIVNQIELAQELHLPPWLSLWTKHDLHPHRVLAPNRECRTLQFHPHGRIPARSLEHIPLAGAQDDALESFGSYHPRRQSPSLPPPVDLAPLVSSLVAGDRNIVGPEIRVGPVRIDHDHPLLAVGVPAHEVMYFPGRDAGCILVRGSVLLPPTLLHDEK